MVLGLSLLTMLFGGVLALDRGDLWYRHIVRRQLKRSQLARAHGRAGLRCSWRSTGSPTDVLRRALRDGNAPFLARWVHDDGYKLHGWETHWSSQTGACQAGLLHGDDHDMPAFRWWEKDLGRAIVTNHPQRRGGDRAPPLERARAAARRRREPREHPVRRRHALDADDEHGARPRPRRAARAGLLRLLRLALRRRAHGAADDRRDRGGALVGDPAGAARRAPARASRLELRRRARVRDRDPARPAGRGGDGRHPRRAAVGLHDVPGLRRGRASQRAGAAGHAGRAAARGPGDRDHRRGGAARAAAVPARGAQRPRPEPGRDVPAALRRGLEDIVRAPRRRRRARRGRAVRRGPRGAHRERDRVRHARHAGRADGPHRGGQAPGGARRPTACRTCP